MSDHTGRRRRRSKLPIGRLLVLLVAIVAVVRLLTLPDPGRAPVPGGSPLAVAPTWAGPKPVDIAGRLADGTEYLPRLYLDPETSIGIAPTDDGSFLRVLIHGAGGEITEIRRVDAEGHPEFDGFVASGDTVVWAESLSLVDEPVATTIWRSNWRSRGRPSTVTTDTGSANFYGGQYDLVVRSGRVYWVALAPGDPVVTEVRSVRLAGGDPSTTRLGGEFILSTWPWAVSNSARGTPVELVNLTTSQRVRVPTQVGEVAACGPTLCRMSVLNGDTMVRMDLVRVDGSDRRRIAGQEATPTIADVAVLDRWIPLATDRGDGQAGVGLSLYDIETGKTDLVAVDAGNIQARNGMLWWSTGTDAELVWHAVDLRTLT